MIEMNQEGLGVDASVITTACKLAVEDIQHPMRSEIITTMCDKERGE